MMRGCFHEDLPKKTIMLKNFDWTQERISFLSDVIVSASVVKADRLEEGPASGAEDPAQKGGVEVTFIVMETFKGTAPSNGHVVLRQHHAPEVTILSSSLEAHDGKSYLLYLRFGDHDRFELTSGRLASSHSIRPRTFVLRPPPSIQLSLR
jgi:hypothetical protein